jgi:hypothetical protein
MFDYVIRDGRVYLVWRWGPSYWAFATGLVPAVARRVTSSGAGAAP